MALLKLGAIVTAISGKIGGQTIGIGPVGQYIKNTGSYINKATPKRKKANAWLAQLVGFWKLLKQSDKDAWNALAPSFPYTNRIGNSVNYSGYNLFARFNYNLQLINKSIQATPLAISGYTPAKLVDFSNNAGNLDLTLLDGDNDPFVKVFISEPMSLGDTQYKKRLRYSIVPQVGDLKATVTMNPYIEALFGAVITPAKYYVSLRQFDPNSGQPLGDELVAFVETV